MTVSSINGIALSTLSAVNGKSLSGLSAINGQTTAVATPVPSTIPSMWDWWEPWREGLGNGVGIQTLTGQLNGRNFTQATSGNRPTNTTGDLNGLATAVVALVSKFWTGPDMSALTAAHAFIIFKSQSDPAADINESGLWYMGTAATSTHVPYTNGLLYDDAFSTTRKDALAHTTNLAAAWAVYEIISTSSEWTRKINGATGGNDFFTTGTNTVACRSAPTLLLAQGAQWRGRFAAMYLCSAKLSAGDRTTLINYINSTFGLSSS